MAQLSERTKTRMAANREAKRIAQLPSIAHKVVVVTENQVWTTIDGVFVGGEVKNFNKIIERLGFRPIRLTKNMLNKQSSTFAIDIDTPSYCDPGCESYHSM